MKIVKESRLQRIICFNLKFSVAIRVDFFIDECQYQNLKLDHIAYDDIRLLPASRFLERVVD